MKKKIKIFLITGILLIMLIIISVKTIEKKEQPSINFGYAYNIGMLPGIVGVERNLFEKQGLKVNPRILTGGKEVVEAMIAGDIDFGLASSGNIIPAASKTDDIKIIATTSWGGGRKRLMIRKDLLINNFSELKSKKIAVKIGGTNYKNLLKLIELSNTNIKDFRIMNMKDDDAMVALQTKDIDAFLCGEPYCATMEYKDVAYELLNFDKTEKDPNFLLIRKDFMEKNPELVIEFLKAWIESVDFVNNNIDESKNIISKKGNIEPEIIDLAIKYARYDSDLDDSMIQSFKEDSKFLLDQKVIEKLPNFDDIIVKRYLAEAIKIK